ncbi:MAG: hypothetical protein M3483_06545, partial [Gemmatimonadota bacterium]|nr:hypothetical protein [Gemmatimonadota bacterium]
MNRQHALLRRPPLLILCAVLVLLGIGALMRAALRDDAPEEAIAQVVRGGGGEPLPADLPPDLPPEIPRLMAEGRNWRAARQMREYLENKQDPRPSVILLAARAEAGWGGWERVRRLLVDAPWLGEAGGEGWLLLAQAMEEEEAWREAADAYERFLASAPEAAAEERAAAELRRALALLRIGEVDAATSALARIRAQHPTFAEWAAALMAESLAERGDTARVRALRGSVEGGLPAERARRAGIRA